MNFQYSEKIEIVSVCISMFVIASTLYLLFTDFNILSYKIGVEKSNIPSLAEILEKRNLVKKRSASLPVWNNVYVNDAVYDKEQIYTATNSSAKIKFDDDTILEIDENSLIVIHRLNGRLSLELLKGEIYGSTMKRELELVTPTAKMMIKSNSKVQIQLIKNKPVINVLEGTSSIESGNRITEIAKNQTGTVIDNGKIETQNLFIELLSPVQNKTYYFSKNINIDFKYKTDKDDLYVEISDNSEFSNSRKFKNSNIILDREGLYYWRVLAFDKDKGSYAYSSNRKFILKKDSPPTLLNPLNDQEISYQDKIRGTLIFDWEKGADFDYYVFNLADNSDFSGKIIEKKIENPPVVLNFLAPGTYYWKVKGIAPQRENSNWSNANKFFITNIKLNYPLNKQEIYLPNNTDELMFKWSHLYGVNNYIIEISKDPDFLKILLASRGKINSFKWNKTTIGLFYWRVKGCDNNWNVLTTSSGNGFKITRDKPQAPVIDSNYKLQIEVE